ncbi:SEC-C metal-binding domain-containing protein [Pseudomonas prosekii]|nr:SEC-C metal-binding domain-containing protein [Pseudomonas prosekii]
MEVGIDLIRSSGNNFQNAYVDVRSPNSISEPAKFPKVGRNEHCPCGSGQKYKKCHGAI